MALSFDGSSIAFGRREAAAKSAVPFGDRSWEGWLIQQSDYFDDESGARHTLGQVMLMRLVARWNDPRYGSPYARALRYLLTVGIAPLYEANGRTLPSVSDNDLKPIGIAYPFRALEELEIRVDLDMLKINASWQAWFSRLYRESEISRQDRYFVLMAVKATIDELAKFTAHMQALGRPTMSVGDGRIKPVPARWTLDDVGGCRRAKQDIADLAWLLTQPDAALAWGRTPPIGALLAGPPGTGKTMLVHALARHSSRLLYSVNMSDIFEKWYGESIRHLKECFTIARASGGVLFFDEADGVVSNRADRTSHEESRRVVDEFCTQIASIRPEENLIVLLATNFEENLDEAAMRAKRVDRIIRVGMPDLAEREDILCLHARKAEEAAPTPLFREDIPWQTLAKQAAGLSGADMAAIIDRSLWSKAVVQARSKVRPPSVDSGDLSRALEEHIRERRRTKDKPLGFATAVAEVLPSPLVSGIEGSEVRP